MMSKPLCATAQALVTTLWAFAALGAPPGAGLLDAAAAQLRGGLGGLRPPELATAVWALATLRHHPGEAFLDAAAADARGRLPAFTPQARRRDFLDRVGLGFGRLTLCLV